MKTYTGGCQCGAIRYRVAGELSDPHLCHCRMCQKASGNYFLPLGGTLSENLSLTRGTPAWFRSSKPVRRGFCRDCGTPLFFDPIESDHIAVTLGSLDQPAAVRIASAYGTEARIPWIADACQIHGERTEEDPAAMEERIAATNRQHPDHDTRQWEPDMGQAD